MTTPRITTAGPSVEPLSRTDLKTYLRVDGDADDALIDELIESARVQAEKYTTLFLNTQTVTLTLEFLPSGSIKLSQGPVQSVASIKYYDTSNTEHTWDAGNYFVDGDRVVFNDSAELPSNLRRLAAVKVTYVAGFGDESEDVPGPIKQGIRHLVAYCYETRETPTELPPSVCAAWNLHRKVLL